ncbi:hypothetical protein JOF47_003467 [Paeniglutamicibacter kerguelensis]|uniref:Uncharacterized protein n=1 Tax=Paeniglutamicibacter kerguelensis TaxID=254788 RepID=A0ABS4XI16_9MICC|nr:hypothetical protein [Paeniglutamicibacter kerguelensis]
MFGKSRRDETDIRIATTAGERTRPTEAKAPAGKGTALVL